MLSNENVAFALAGVHTAASIEGLRELVPLLRKMLAAAMVLAYAYAMYGLIHQLHKVRTVADEGPRQMLAGLLSNLGRFGAWGLIGAMVFSAEPESGLVFLLTRPLGFVLLLLVIAHRGHPRASAKRLMLLVALPAALYGLLLTLVGLAEAPVWLAGVLYTLVGVFFASAGFALISELRDALRNGTFRKGRHFQYGMFWNFALGFLYGFVTDLSGLGWVMLLGFGMMTVLQGVLCLLIWKRRAAFRSQRRSADRRST